jgi:hypothetical protein
MTLLYFVAASLQGFAADFLPEERNPRMLNQDKTP